MKTIYQEESKRLKKNLEQLEKIVYQQSNRLKVLEKENTELKIELDEHKIIFEDIEHKYKKLLNAKALSAIEGSVEETKKTINNLIREIDTCVALLNE